MINFLENLTNKFTDPQAIVDLFFPVFALSMILVALRPRPFGTREQKNRLCVAAVWSSVCYVAYAIHYLFLPTFYDHVEPTIMNTARYFSDDLPLYHDVDAAYRYSQSYGPTIYLFNRASQCLFGNSLAAAKTPNVVFALASLGLVAATLWSTSRTRECLYIGLIYFCGTCVLFRYFMFFMRPDPQLLFWMSLAIFGATRRSSLIAFLLLGVAFGGCINCKIHSVLYFSPLISLLWTRITIRGVAIFIVTAAITGFLPFLLFSEISLSNHLMWLRLATKHGFGANQSAQVFEWMGIITMPAIIAGCRMIKSWPSSEQRAYITANRIGIALAMGGILTFMVLASKEGSGYWHLMPFLPVWTYFLSAAHDRKRPAPEGEEWLARSFQLAFVCLGCLSVTVALIIAQGLLRSIDFNEANRVASEFAEITNTYGPEGVAMGYGSNITRLSLMRPLLNTRDSLLVDAAAIMDMNYSGVEIPEATLKLFRDGKVKAWLIPRGEPPFTALNWYNYQPLFGDKFRNTFLAYYERTGQTDHFDIWTYRGSR